MDGARQRDAETMPALQFAKLERRRRFMLVRIVRPNLDGKGHGHAETMPALQFVELGQ